MQVRPGTTYRGDVSLTRFDPIKNSPGTRDYVNASTGSARPINGTLRNSVVRTDRGIGTYRPSAVESEAEPWNVPSLPRRPYIPRASVVPNPEYES